VLEVLLGHHLVAYGEVLAVEDLLEVAPDESFVGLRHGASSFTFLPARSRVA
jgi:hypothetical protein